VHPYRLQRASETIQEIEIHLENRLWNTAINRLYYAYYFAATALLLDNDIKGNEYRLIVDIEYKLKIVFIVWLGTHEEYDKIDAKTVRYEN